MARAPLKSAAPKTVRAVKAKRAKQGGLLRGVALVDAVMEQRRRKGEKLVGTPAAELAKLTVGGLPLSPALHAWLMADAETFTLGEPQTLVEMVRADFGDDWAQMYGELTPMLPEKIVLFEGWGSDSRRFLYLGKTDEHGEYTVMTIDTDDTPFLCVNGPVDVWLAQHAGFLAEESVYGKVPKAYESARKEHATLNFEGHSYWEFGDFH